MLKPVSATLAVCLSLSSSFAAVGTLPAAEIRKLVTGATVEIDAPLGNKLPVEYAQDGRLAGQARGLASHLGSASDKGRWWVEADKLCQLWERWFNAEPQCLELQKEAGRIRWRDSRGNTGMATVIAQSPKVARAGNAGEQERSAIQFTRPRTFPPQTPPAIEPARKPAPANAEFDTVPPPATPRKPPLEGRMSIGAPVPPAAPAIEAKPASPQPPPAAPPIARSATPHPRPEAKPAPSLSTQSAPKSPAFKVTNVAATDVLNVRSGPSAEHDIVGSLAPETAGIHLTGDCRSKWCRIEHRSLTGWVNRSFLSDDAAISAAPNATRTALMPRERDALVLRDAPDAPRSCLTSEARALLGRIEAKFGPVRAVSTCRPGARIAGTGRISKHANGNAIDFDAGSRKEAIVEWLIANHTKGGTMTYPHMDHIHVDIGPHFVSLASGRRVASRSGPWGERMGFDRRN